MRLINWLNKPYPLITSVRDKMVLIFSFGLFVAIFLIVFRPFDADKIKGFQIPFLMGFGLSVITALSICYFLIPSIFRSWFNADRWQIKKEIPFLLFCFFIVSICNFSYNNYIGKEIAVERSFLEFFGITIAIGIFPVIILIFLVELILNRKNTTNAQQINEQLVKNNFGNFPKKISIVPETAKDGVMELILDDFFYATSDNNYTTIVFKKEDHLTHKLLRLSLKKLEEQLYEYTMILRVHRSYLVNKSKIKKVAGNARSLSLELTDCEHIIPVSRTFPREVLF